MVEKWSATVSLLMEITDLKVYVPAEDFEASKRFYKELGFTLKPAWGGTFDCELGRASFRLQDFYVKDWAHNFMMRFNVDDVGAWHQHVKKMLAGGVYKNVRVQEPENVGDTLVLHVIDPSGVLLIFVQ